MHWIAIAAAAASTQVSPTPAISQVELAPASLDVPQDAILEWIDSLLDLYYEICDLLGPEYCKYAQASVDVHLLTFSSAYQVHGLPTLTEQEQAQVKTLLQDLQDHLDNPLAGSMFAVNSARSAAASALADLQ